MAGKIELGIVAAQTPRYSPDLNRLDFALWTGLEHRAMERSSNKNETVASDKARLRRGAPRLLEMVVRKVVADMKRCAQAVVNAKGGNIPRDWASYVALNFERASLDRHQ